jgi:deoxyadenosine/deoxycytidine kinase
MRFIIGLVGSGKTTLYRQLNENKTMNAVEIELPQSCINDELLKSKLFELYYHNNNVDCIIAHPYYLPKDFWQRVSDEDTIIYLDIPLDERLERIKKRSKELETNPGLIFPWDYLLGEEECLRKFKEEGNKNAIL